MYTYCGQVTDWTLTLTLTLKKEKGECFDLIFLLNSILKRTMTCEASVGVSRKTVTVLSWTIFSCAGDRLAPKMSLYVEF